VPLSETFSKGKSISMSAKSVAEKLAIKPGAALWISHPDRRTMIDPLPDQIQWVDRLENASIGLFVAEDAASLRKLLADNGTDLSTPATVWVAYPKANRTDLNRDSLWPIVSEYGLRPNGQVAVDDVWSALRFRALREGERPFTGGH
jgi:hypothetical protein